jgi:hypothetical protein
VALEYDLLVHKNLLERRGDNYKLVWKSIKLPFKKTSPIVIISPICFYLNNMENCNNDRSTEAQLKK